MKKVLIISTSLRENSNSDTLATAFLRGAKDVGNETKYISLMDKEIAFCKGCMACQHHKKDCVIKDDAIEIASLVKEADVLVFATPIYYYGISGQMKTLLDRLNPLYDTDYKFREVYLVAAAADKEEKAIDGAINNMECWISCFDKAKLAGTVKGVGIEFPGDAFTNSDILQTAYDMGKNV